MNKHAYLIMAHTDLYVLKKLLELLDDSRNDIYLHIDKKLKNVDFQSLRAVVKHSEVYFVDRMDVRWGSSLQIDCEINLLKEATKRTYTYYHLISGVDLPIKTQDEIHAFFNNSGKEFVEFDNFSQIDDSFLDRIKYYHLCANHLRSSNNFLAKLACFIRFHSVNFQKKMNIDRLKKSDVVFQKGPNWFSITHDLAVYILSQTKFLKYFDKSFCADELFVQTIVFNSEFKDRVYLENGATSCKREIDWERGKPYTFTLEDFSLLCNSDCFFARKFSSSVDKEIIDKLVIYLQKGDKL